ncbi:MAG: DNA methyltransferase [Thermoplasmata archaeon]
MDLVYMDPPFGSGTDYEVVFKDGVEIRHFKDRWVGGKQGYLNWLEPRVRECHRVLKDTGTFYIHCDDHLNAQIRLLLDDVFGEGHFLNEIIWKRTFSHGTTRAFGRVHDTLLSYTKSDEYTWNPQRQEYSEHYKESKFRFADPDGRRFRRTILTGPGTAAGESGKPWKGYDPTSKGRHWAVPGYMRREMDPPPATVQEALDRLEGMGRVLWPKKGGGTPEFKQYMNDMEGTDLQDIWTDIDPLNSQATNRQGFPTQKPPELLERVIKASSNPGDVVLDPVCGCGTTVLASASEGRKWIGVDISPTACRLVAKRVSLPLNEIVGLPRSMAEIKEMVKLDPIEFQNWVCDVLGAVSTTKRGSAPHADGGIDGWILSMTPISVKGSEGIGYPEIERFEKSLQKRGKSDGFFVAFSFSKPAYEEAVRASREDKVTIDLLEVREKVVSANGGNPDVRAYLFSELTKRSWGEETGRGPAPPPPLMIPVRPPRRARVKRLGEAMPAPPAELTSGETKFEPKERE